MDAPTRLYEIDLLRFFAAMTVVIFHYTFAGNALEATDIEVFWGISAFTRYGYLGVDLFFLISGFVITLSAERASPQRFLSSRFIRLYPAFFIAVILSAIARNYFGGENDDLTISTFLLNISLLPGLFESWNDMEFIDGVYWSLMAEMKFYFLILIALMMRLRKHLQWVMLVWLIVTLASDQVSLPTWLDEFLLLEWSPYFIAGAMFYQIHEKGPSLIRIVAIAACLHLSIDYAVWRLDEITEIYTEDFSVQYVTLIILSLYLIFALLVADILKPLRHPSMLILGGLTYPLYLIHQNIGYILFNHTEYLNQPFVQLAIVTSSMVMLSAIIHLLIEQPIAQALKNKLFH